MNPAELAIDLQCLGLRVESCDTGRGVRRTRAGLGSGLDLVLPGPCGDVWINAPVTERFARDSPLSLRGDAVYDARSGACYAVRIPACPSWYARETSSGRRMADVGVLQGTYLGVYVGTTCAFWHMRDPAACAFCTTGLNVDAGSRPSVEDVVETARAAKEESGVTFVHLNTGFQRGRALRMVAPYVQALKERVGVLVGVQVVPEGTLSELDALRDLGADHFSFCFEYFDPDAFARLCPGKHAWVGQARYFEALEHCQARMPRGSCSGEMIAGNEPVEATLRGIDWVTSVGAFPTVCIFRPLLGSALEDAPPPSPADMRRVFAHVWARCRDRRIPIGLAPNIQVSLVLQPTDTAYLAPGGWRDRLYLAWLGALRRLAAPRFRRLMRPRAPTPSALSGGA